MITRSFRYGISSPLTLLLRSTNFILEIQFGLADLEYIQIKILFNGILKVSKVLFYFSEMLLFKFIQSYLVIPIIDEMHCCRHASLRFWRTFTWILAKLTDKGVPFTMFNNRILLVKESFRLVFEFSISVIGTSPSFAGFTVFSTIFIRCHVCTCKCRM